MSTELWGGPTEVQKYHLHNPVAPAENENYSEAPASHPSRDEPPASHSGPRAEPSEAFSSLPQRQLQWGEDPVDSATFPENRVASTRHAALLPKGRPRAKLGLHVTGSEQNAELTETRAPA